MCCVIRELGVINEQEMRWVPGVPGKLGAQGTLEHRYLSEHCPLFLSEKDTGVSLSLTINVQRPII